jgi:hypothetical protein
VIETRVSHFLLEGTRLGGFGERDMKAAFVFEEIPLRQVRAIAEALLGYAQRRIDRNRPRGFGCRLAQA